MNTILNTISIILGIITGVVLVFGLMTPEKTLDGEYTNIYKYWFDDQYLCEEFKYCSK